MSKSDPIVEVSSQTNNSGWRVIGKTECIQNDLNPNFATSFNVKYHFEKMTQLQFRVVDIDSSDQDLDKGDFLGQATTNLHEIVGSKNQTVTKKLDLGNGKQKGTINLRVEEITTGNDFIEMDVSAQNLKKVTCALCGQSPMFEISRTMEDGGRQLVYRSSIASGTSCTWRKLAESMQKLCNNDRLRPLKFEVLHANSNSNNVLIGATDISINQFLEGGVKEFTLTASDGKTSAGTIGVKNINLRKEYAFIDFITAGFEINLISAVDFTASNGNPGDSGSLHYINPNGTPNEYQSALRAVGEITLYYDSDKLVPMYGFGGQFKGKTSHAFPMNGNQDNPEVFQLDGMLETYRQSISTYELSGPTRFSNVLSTAVNEAQEIYKKNGKGYVIMLILTDGVIHDMAATIDQVVAGSRLPLSIIIVGIGNADFSQMNELDADETPLRDGSGRLMSRDIVQFVPFRECSRDMNRLRDEVLAEVPAQLTSYFKSRNITPH